MKLFVVTLGALLIAAPVFSQVENEALRFTLHEQRSQAEQKLGRPANVTTLGDLESWQYQIGIEDHHEFSHQLVFRVSTGELISFTQNYEPSQSVDALFPNAESRVEFYPDREHPAMAVRVRPLSDGRVLVALGAEGPTAQVMVIRQSELKNFQPWLWERLDSK